MDRLPLDDVLIRPAMAEDAAVIAQLWQRLIEYHRQLDDDLPNPTPQGPSRYARSLSQRVDDSHTCTYVAESEGRLVGYVLGVVVDFPPEMFEQEPSGFLADIFVEESARREGIGRALVDALAVWFHEKGLRYFEWHVASRNPNAIEFWQALGGRDMMIRMRAEIKPGDDADDGTSVSDG